MPIAKFSSTDTMIDVIQTTFHKGMILMHVKLQYLDLSFYSSLCARFTTIEKSPPLLNRAKVLFLESKDPQAVNAIRVEVQALEYETGKIVLF